MVDDIAGVSFAQGRGFDSWRLAQQWCDSFILGNNPGKISILRDQANELEAELVAARNRTL